jgi:hypothetical protein
MTGSLQDLGNWCPEAIHSHSWVSAYISDFSEFAYDHDRQEAMHADRVCFGSQSRYR